MSSTWASRSRSSGPGPGPDQAVRVHRRTSIEIQFIGLRPGEKLYEEILVDDEKAKATEFDKIFVAPPIEVDGRRFSEMLTALLEAAEAGDEKSVLRSLKDIGIGYNHTSGGAA